MVIKAILFDLDNTLYDYDSSHKLAMDDVYNLFKKYEEKLNYKDFKELYDASKEEIHKELSGTASAHNRILYFKRMFERLGKRLDAEKILNLNDLYWDSLMNNMKLNEGALEVLEYCKKKEIKIAIVSDLIIRVQLKKIHKLKIDKYIDVLITSEETGSEKPHAIMFLLALNKLKVFPQEAIMVGDNYVADIIGANYIDLNTVLLNDKNKLDYNIKKNLEPNFTIKKINELIKIIEDFELKKVQDEGYTKFNCIFKKSNELTKKDIVEINKYRRKLYDIRLIGAYENKIGYGNLSIRDSNKFIITGSTTGNFKTLNEQHYSVINKYDIENNEIKCSGNIKASSESLTHMAIYECDKDINAVIHIHNLEMWEKYKNKLPTTKEFATYGTPEIAYEIKRIYKEGFKEKQIAVLGGHKEGIIVFGKDLEEAYNIILDYYNKV